MAQANFKFKSEALGGDNFEVVSFKGTEAISSLYHYEIEVRARLSAGIDLDDVLDSPASFITEHNGREYPVYGVLSSLDELQTVLGYVYYRLELVPKLWRLSIYQTNEIYTTEKIVSRIIQTVLEAADLSEGIDFDLAGLNDNNLLERDYVCQFGESDFDFISRLMENEGIFYYFDHTGPSEKIIFINDLNYLEIPRPSLFFDVTAQASRQHDCISAWSCRRKRLAARVTVRDFNPNQPSLDISNTTPIDAMGQGTEYLYGENISDTDEAAYLCGIRAEERLCHKTRYYGESAVTRLQAGYTFNMAGHSNDVYNKVGYLTIEVAHEGQHLKLTGVSSEASAIHLKPQYTNSFVAIEASEQYRPARKTAKPRFYGTMTAFIYNETRKMNAEIDEQGRYRVNLPFDRADGTLQTTDPDRKASTWMRMAQPYVGVNQGMYYPLAGGTEVLLTFINGDPDQPVISAALPNASQPSLVTDQLNLQRTITTQVSQTVTGNKHTVSLNSAATELLENPPAALDPTVIGTAFINQDETQATLPPSISMLPPWDGLPITATTPAYDANLIKLSKYDKDLAETDMVTADLSKVDTARSAGDNYVYANARTFSYPQHERVYFIGTFHEDFHVKDGFLNKAKSWTGKEERFNFPEPNGKYPENMKGEENTDAQVNPKGIRGVSEDKRWGDQMSYSYGRVFTWGAGKGILEASEEINYGTSVTENLINSNDGRFKDVVDKGEAPHSDMYKNAAACPAPNRAAGSVPNPYTPRDYKKIFFDDGALAEYVFVDGNTYSYQSGDDLDVNYGESDSWVYGNSRDYVFGHTCSWVNGDSISYTLGSETSMLFGNSNSMAIGFTTDTFVGLKTETFVGGAIVIELSATQGLNAAKDFRADLFEDKVAAKENRAALNASQQAVSIMIKSLQNDVKALSVHVNAVKYSVEVATKISFVTPVFNCTALLTKIG